MSAEAATQFAFAILLFGIGYLVIRALGLHLPLPRNAYELIAFSFYHYPPEIERHRIVTNKIAWFCVVVVSYLIMTSVF